MTTAHYTDESVRLYHGDCIEVMRSLPDASVDAVVTDPPYGLEFMGKEWDRFDATPNAWATRDKSEDLTGKSSSPFLAAAVNKFQAGAPFQLWCTEWATEALRVLKPGGHLLAFGGTRTWHRLACAIEDAGFEVRDSIAWMYGSGFPKSLNVAKAIHSTEVHGGANSVKLRQSVMGDDYVPSGKQGNRDGIGAFAGDGRGDVDLIPNAAKWQGWGTALKPAFEPVVVARKPLIGTVAANVERYGTGAINIDGTRIGTADGFGGGSKGSSGFVDGYESDGFAVTGKGRWPANVILDESQARELDRQSGEAGGGFGRRGSVANAGDGQGMFGIRATGEMVGYGDTGGASRFFYTAKADSSERPRVDGVAHPTVKPLDLMRYLVRLVTPPGGVVLEPFAGSGTTLEACIVEGFRCIGIEREADYIPLIMQRITKPIEPVLW